MSRVIGIAYRTLLLVSAASAWHLDLSEHRYPTMWHNHCQKQFLLTVRFVHCVSKPSLIFSFTSLSLSLSLSYSIACSLRFLQVWQHCLSFLSPSLSLSLSLPNFNFQHPNALSKTILPLIQTHKEKEKQEQKTT